MEEERKKKKRWSVTYTRHIKQKRKIFQDGFLDLHISTNKLMLYDESEKLLECRMLREDEVVSSSETLTFSSYFVDVGLLHDSHFQSDSTMKKNNKARPIDLTLSPSQKIIREFKKSELQKYGAPQTSPTTLKTSLTEWQVLYTTQLTQKSKKYHDGFLRLSACGSLGRQVMLFDEQRKLLESKFLKRDVVIRSGESIPLDAHLVDIGECNGNNLEGNDSKTDGKMGIRHERKNQLENGGAFGKDDKTCEVQTFGTGLSTARTIKSSMKEWQVMYTTQVTQKAKKYHDGFLQLTNSGSLQRQIMLYDGSKKLINSRFLKKDEVIQSGETIAFDAHLVDIGEPEGNYQGLMDSDVHISNHNVAGKSVLMNRVPNSLKTNKSFLKGKPQKIACSRGFADSSFSIPDINETKLSNNISANKPLDDGKPQKMACSRGYADPSFSISNINEIKFSEGISANKPFRDAIQIMSILQKPMKQDSFASGSIDKKITNPAPFTKEPQNSDSSRNIAECDQSPRISVAHHVWIEKAENSESSECVDIEKFHDPYSKAKSCCSGDEPLNNIEVGDSHQPLSDNVEAYTQETDDVTKNSVELKISTETGGRPSFDLGFD